MTKKVNPFIYDKNYHYFLAYEYVNSRYWKALDLGCGNGRFIGKIKDKFGKVYGYDVDRQKIKEGKKKFPHVEFSLGEIGKPLPYRNNFFDVVFLFHVLEHVDSEEKLIKEISRVLKKKGKLLLSSPYDGIFSWADAANIRYRFPKIHEFLIKMIFEKRYYEKYYLRKAERKLFGDSSLQRSWHFHYKESDIRRILENHFNIRFVRKYGLFIPFLHTLHNFFNFVIKTKNLSWVDRLIWLDNKIEVGDYSYNFFAIATNKK